MLTIRKIVKGDAQTLGKLAAEVFTMPWSEQAFAELAQDKNSLFLVAEKEGRILGGCGLTHILNEGDIHNVMVVPEEQGKGIGSKLVKCLLEEGSKLGITEFTLEVRVSNGPAIHLYEKLGFVSEGVRPRFYEQPVEDAMIMWKR